MKPCLCPLFLGLALATTLAWADDVAPEPTVITSQSAEARTVGAETSFLFTGLVTVTGTDIKLTCDRLEVLAESTNSTAKKADKPGILNESGRFKHLLATGRVRIVQGERVATCGRAEVFPDRDEVVLTEKPMLEDPEVGTATAHLIRLKRGERSGFLEAGPDGVPRIVTRPLPPLGYSGSAGAKKETATDAAPKIPTQDSTKPLSAPEQPKTP
jgi:lipopolysaccharide export system protein LptA